MLLLIGVWIFFMKQMQSGKGGGALGFGRSKAKLLNENKQKLLLTMLLELMKLNKT